MILVSQHDQPPKQPRLLVCSLHHQQQTAGDPIASAHYGQPVAVVSQLSPVLLQVCMVGGGEIVIKYCSSAVQSAATTSSVSLVLVTTDVH